MKRVATIAVATIFTAILCFTVLDINTYYVGSFLQLDQPVEGPFGGLTPELVNMNTLAFTENAGQWDEEVMFRADAGDATMWFTADGVYYQITRRVTSSGERQTSESEPSDVFEYLKIKESFIGANPDPAYSGNEQMSFRSNYFLGNDPAKWRTGVPNYESILVEEIYPGIDLKYYSNGEQIEYDLILSPGADPGRVMVQYDGAESISINDGGELVVETEWGTVTELLPFAYQLDDGVPVPIEAEYVLFPNNKFGFGLGESYDPTLATVIDPAIAYSTYIGGGSSDKALGIKVDLSGNAYIVGTTASADFPTEGEYQTHQGIADVFVTKLNTTGDGLVYSTYIGGTSNEEGWDIDIDDSGNAYITGHTISSNYPTVGEYQTFQGGVDVIVTKLNSTGDGLVYSTYLGGSDIDHGRAIAVGGSNAAYVTGTTQSTDFPTNQPFQTDQIGSDAFVTKFNSAGNGLVYSTYLGGDGVDRGSDIVVDPDSGMVPYVTGYTSSTDFPTQGEYQTHQGAIDVFVTSLQVWGFELRYSTYVGGSNDDGNSIAYDNSIAVDADGFAYVTGSTNSTDFPTVNAYQTDQSLGDVFVFKLNQAGNDLVYSTYIGGSGNEAGLGIAVNESGEAYVTGETESTDFPTHISQRTYQGNYDAFMLQLSISGNVLGYSTYLGGEADDIATDIAIDGSDIYLSGYTESSDFPAQDEYQTHQGGRDCFVTKFDDRLCGDANSNEEINIDDVIYIINYLWNGSPEPPVHSKADCDGLPGVSCHDEFILNNYIFIGGDVPICAPFGDTTLPVSNDVVELRNTTVTAGETEWDVDVWLTMNGDQVLGLCLPLSFSCPTSPIVCDSISYVGSIYSVPGGYVNKFSLIDTAGQKLLIGIPRIAAGSPDVDSGLVARLTFTVNSSASDQIIIFDTTAYPVEDGRDSNTVLFSKVSGADPYAVIPSMPDIGLQHTVVTNLNDVNYGSLRYAMNYADTSAGDDTITFAVSGVIELQSALPAIDGPDQLHIDGTTAPGGAFSVIVDGTNVPVGPGFAIAASSGNLITGLTIRNFPGHGIVIGGPSAFTNNVSNNLIYDNGGLGIDLGDDGVTENDSLDLDTGPNHLLNYPEIDSVIMNPDSSFTVHGNTAWAPTGTQEVSFYIARRGGDPSHVEDPSGHGEAYEYIGSATPIGAEKTFEFEVPNTVPFFSVLTSIAIEIGGGRNLDESSEFGENFVLAPAPLVVYGYSPINLMIIDPNGFRFGKYGDETFIEEIAPADYYEEPDIDSVVIHHPIRGTYHVEVYGTADAQPGDTYTMGTRIDGSTQVVIVTDEDVPLYGTPPDDYEYEVEEDWHYVNGDANRSGGVDIDDVVFMIAYIFSGGAIPDPPGAGDANCSLELDIDDVVYLIAYIFSGGPPPCDFGDI